MSDGMRDSAVESTRIVEVRKVLAKVFAGSKPSNLSEADQISVLAHNYEMLKQDVAKLHEQIDRERAVKDKFAKQLNNVRDFVARVVDQRDKALAAEAAPLVCPVCNPVWEKTPDLLSKLSSFFCDWGLVKGLRKGDTARLSDIEELIAIFRQYCPVEKAAVCDRCQGGGVVGNGDVPCPACKLGDTLQDLMEAERLLDAVAEALPARPGDKQHAQAVACVVKQWDEALALINEVRSVVFDLQVLGTRPGLRASEVNARAEDWCRRAQEFDILHGGPSSSRVADEFPYPQPCGCDARSVVSGCPRHDPPQGSAECDGCKERDSAIREMEAVVAAAKEVSCLLVRGDHTPTLQACIDTLRAALAAHRAPPAPNSSSPPTASDEDAKVLRQWQKSGWALVGTEILTSYDTCAWVACWTRRDIIANGKTEQEAVERLLWTIALNWIDAESIGTAPKDSPPRPPEAILESWRRRHKQSHNVCICHETVVGKSVCQKHGPHPASKP